MKHIFEAVTILRFARKLKLARMVSRLLKVGAR
jgi:hypothetical protein